MSDVFDMRASVVKVKRSELKRGGFRTAGLRSLGGRVPQKPRKTQVRARGRTVMEVWEGTGWRVARVKIGGLKWVRWWEKGSRQGAGPADDDILPVAR